jgi:hypothetical protein
MTEPNIKIMKLSSGEEIICTVVTDEHPRTYNVTYPMKVMTVPRVTGDGVEESLSLTRWIHFAEESIADIPKTQVLAIVNASLGMKRFYEYCVQKLESDSDLDDLDGPSDFELEDDEYLDDFEDIDTPSKLIH